jgi:hypothetical protein
MLVFAILSPSGDNPVLSTEIAKHFPNDSLKIGPGQWLVAGRQTAVEVSNTVGISGGQTGSAMVLSISAYWGRADNNVWEWMRVKLSTL